MHEGPCIKTDCQTSGLGDLSFRTSDSRIVGCLSPCKKWSTARPYGLGIWELEGDGQLLCCPTPPAPINGKNPVTFDECRNETVAQTKYVKLFCLQLSIQRKRFTQLHK